MAAMEPIIAITVDGEWRAGIGDPTLLGWFTVIAYMLGAWICFRAARSARAFHMTPGHFYFWILFALALCALGVNKQLDLQTWFTIAGKRFAQETGWYESRRIVQMVFIVLMGLAGLALIGAGLRWTRNLPRPYKVALAGGVFLMCFILIRAASFHHVDQMLGLAIGGVRMNVFLEIGGIACVAFAAWQASRDRSSTTPDLHPSMVQS